MYKIIETFIADAPYSCTKKYFYAKKMVSYKKKKFVRNIFLSKIKNASF